MIQRTTMHLFTTQLTRCVGANRIVNSAMRYSSLKTPPLAPLAVALFDGSCPICAKEISFLKRFKTSDNVQFIDVTGPSFNAAQWSLINGQPPIKMGTLLSEMHVLDTTKNILRTRVPAFRFLYATMGCDILSFTAHEPWASRADSVYTYIADNKHRLAFLFNRRIKV
jgi:predicted DCC family thiol-disulfide oxidoreductase YuxK